jgi:uncharacterized SAM-dependent methyltransferase
MPVGFSVGLEVQGKGLYDQPGRTRGAAYSPAIIATRDSSVSQVFHRRPFELPEGYLTRCCSPEAWGKLTGSSDYYVASAARQVIRENSSSIASLIEPGTELLPHGNDSDQSFRTLQNALTREHTRQRELVRGRLNSPGLLRRVYNSQAPEFGGWMDRAVRADHHRLRPQALWISEQALSSYTPAQASTLLSQLSQTSAAAGGLLVAVDLIKNRQLLESAYNDANGGWDAINHEVLTQLNRDCEANFQPTRFYHSAFYNPSDRRIEMHLVSKVKQTVRVAGQQVHIAAGESIRTSCIQKYSISEFATVAANAGLVVRKAWTDSRGWFSIHYLLRAQAENLAA